MKILCAIFFPVLFVILTICVFVFGDKKEILEKNKEPISDFNITELKFNEHNYLLFEKNNHNFKQIIHSPDCKCKKNDFFPF